MSSRIRFKVKYLIILGLILVGVIGWLKIDFEIAKNSPVNPQDTGTYSFFIKPGESATRIAANLQKDGLINNDTYFYWNLRLSGKVPSLVAGRFMLSPSMNYDEIAEIITNANQSEAVIVVQEGLRVRDIDAKLVELSLIQPGEFIAAAKNYKNKEKFPLISLALLSNAEIPIEGYLYPDTYFIEPINFNSNTLIEKMLTNFENKITPEMINTIDSGEHNLHETIIMASIIEKEVRTAQDLKIVSGILWKRLETPGWTLGADATLLYEKSDNTITAEDLRKDSQYNTRKNGGLPPSAISNPSIESIKAAIYPESSDYWFYLTTTDTGEVIYAKTNDEHNRNREKYLQ